MQEIARHDNGTITVSGECCITGHFHSVTVSAEGYDRWRAGTRIQFALPNASAEEREWLKSGISPVGWYEAFGDEDEEDDEPIQGGGAIMIRMTPSGPCIQRIC
jgi:hypothetical protein